MGERGSRGRAPLGRPPERLPDGRTFRWTAGSAVVRLHLTESYDRTAFPRAKLRGGASVPGDRLGAREGRMNGARKHIMGPGLVDRRGGPWADRPERRVTSWGPPRRPAPGLRSRGTGGALDRPSTPGACCATGDRHRCRRAPPERGKVGCQAHRPTGPRTRQRRTEKPHLSGQGRAPSAPTDGHIDPPSRGPSAAPISGSSP